MCTNQPLLFNRVGVVDVGCLTITIGTQAPSSVSANPEAAAVIIPQSSEYLDGEPNQTRSIIVDSRSCDISRMNPQGIEKMLQRTTPERTVTFWDQKNSNSNSWDKVIDGIQAFVSSNPGIGRGITCAIGDPKSALTFYNLLAQIQPPAARKWDKLSISDSPYAGEPPQPTYRASWTLANGVFGYSASFSSKAPSFLIKAKDGCPWRWMIKINDRRLRETRQPRDTLIGLWNGLTQIGFYVPRDADFIKLGILLYVNTATMSCLLDFYEATISSTGKIEQLCKQHTDRSLL